MRFEEKAEFNRFVKKAVFVILPLLLIFVFFDVMAISLGEVTSVSRVIKVQNEKNNPDVLYGRKVVDQELRRYKYELFLSRNSDIIALGSSRILSMREEFFKPFYTFTNLGSMTHNLGDVDDFAIRLATSSTPKYAFLSLDYYWFGKHRTAQSGLTEELTLLSASKDWRAHTFASRYLLLTFLKNPRKIVSYFSKDNQFKGSFGFQGREGNGYKVDGSYLYSIFLKELRVKNEYQDREQPPIIDRIRNGSGSYVLGEEFANERIEMLDNVLKKLKSKNYYVIGLDLPFSSEVYSELTTNRQLKDFFSTYRTEIPKVFKNNGFVFFDYSDLNKLALSDIYMFDGVHHSETAMAKMLAYSLKGLDKDFPNARQISLRLSNILSASSTSSFELGQWPTDVE